MKINKKIILTSIRVPGSRMGLNVLTLLLYSFDWVLVPKTQDELPYRIGVIKLCLNRIQTEKLNFGIILFNGRMMISLAVCTYWFLLPKQVKTSYPGPWVVCKNTKTIYSTHSIFSIRYNEIPISVTQDYWSHNSLPSRQSDAIIFCYNFSLDFSPISSRTNSCFL